MTEKASKQTDRKNESSEKQRDRSDRSQETARTASRNTDPLARLHGHAGNQALQRSLSNGSGGLPPGAGLSSGPAATGIPIGSPDSPAEREAERIASRVAGGSDSTSGPGRVSAGGTAGVQRRANGDGGGGQAPPIVGEVVGSSGQSLDEGIRRSMESRIGADLGDVEVHTGPKAARSAEAVNARAYTVGSDVAFDAGEYDPGSAEGRGLLAHELTHVAQQSGGVRRVQREGSGTTTDTSTGTGEGSDQGEGEFDQFDRELAAITQGFEERIDDVISGFDGTISIVKESTTVGAVDKYERDYLEILEQYVQLYSDRILNCKSKYRRYGEQRDDELNQRIEERAKAALDSILDVYGEGITHVRLRSSEVREQGTARQDQRPGQSSEGASDHTQASGSPPENVSDELGRHQSQTGREGAEPSEEPVEPDPIPATEGEQATSPTTEDSPAVSSGNDVSTLQVEETPNAAAKDPDPPTEEDRRKASSPESLIQEGDGVTGLVRRLLVGESTGASLLGQLTKSLREAGQKLREQDRGEAAETYRELADVVQVKLNAYASEDHQMDLGAAIGYAERAEQMAVGVEQAQSGAASTLAEVSTKRNELDNIDENENQTAYRDAFMGLYWAADTVHRKAQEASWFGNKAREDLVNGVGIVNEIISAGKTDDDTIDAVTPIRERIERIQRRVDRSEELAAEHDREAHKKLIELTEEAVSEKSDRKTMFAGYEQTKKSLGEALREYIEATRQKESLRREFGVIQLKEVKSALKQEGKMLLREPSEILKDLDKIDKARQRKTNAYKKVRKFRKILDDEKVDEVAEEIDEGIFGEEAAGAAKQQMDDAREMADKGDELVKGIDMANSNYSDMYQNVQSIAEAGVGSKSFTIDISGAAKLGFTEVSEAKVGGGIRITGTWGRDTDRRFRVTHQLVPYGKTSAKLAKVAEASFEASVGRKETRVYRDAKHWAAKTAVAFQDFLDTLKKNLGGTEGKRGRDKEKLKENLQDLEEMGVIDEKDKKDYKKTIDIAESEPSGKVVQVEDKLSLGAGVGVGFNITGKEELLTFERGSEQTERRSALKAEISGTVNVGSAASFGVTVYGMSNHANPDNDGLYLVLSGSLSPSLAAKLESTTDEKPLEQWEQDLREGLGHPAQKSIPEQGEAAKTNIKDIIKNFKIGDVLNLIKSSFKGLGVTVFGDAFKNMSFNLKQTTKTDLEIGFVWPRDFSVGDPGSFKPKLQFRRFSPSVSTEAGGTVPIETGQGASGEVGLTVSGNEKWMKSETIGTDTLTYVLTVFNGLKPADERDQRLGDLEESAVGQWDSFVEAHERELALMLLDIGKGKGGVWKEIEDILDEAKPGNLQESKEYKLLPEQKRTEALQLASDATNAIHLLQEECGKYQEQMEKNASVPGPVRRKFEVVLEKVGKFDKKMGESQWYKPWFPKLTKNRHVISSVAPTSPFSGGKKKKKLEGTSKTRKEWLKQFEFQSDRVPADLWAAFKQIAMGDSQGAGGWAKSTINGDVKHQDAFNDGLTREHIVHGHETSNPEVHRRANQWAKEYKARHEKYQNTVNKLVKGCKNHRDLLIKNNLPARGFALFGKRGKEKWEGDIKEMKERDEETFEQMEAVLEELGEIVDEIMKVEQELDAMPTTPTKYMSGKSQTDSTSGGSSDGESNDERRGFDTATEVVWASDD